MKKTRIIAMLLAILMVFVAVSCEEEPVHEHVYGKEWKSDATNHWYECECGEKADVTTHSFEVVASEGKPVKKCSICGYISDDEINDAAIASTAEELKNAYSGTAKTIYLGADITSSDKVDLKDDTTLDLNGKKLSLVANDTITEDGKAKNVSLVVEGKSVTIKNGTLESTGECSYGIVLEKNGELSLDNVQYTSIARAIKVLASADNSSLAITNSVVETNGGAFAIQTDATPVESSGVTISIKNSIVKAGGNVEEGCIADDSTALMFNVNGTVTIEDSEFYGRRQAAIFRGGDYKVKNSTFESTSTSTNYYDSGDYVDASWKSGNEVPLAAIVIGNRSASYPYATKIAFEGTNTLIVHETEVRKQLYVYQSDETEGVDRTVTVTGADSSWFVNTEKNGASYTTK